MSVSKILFAAGATAIKNEVIFTTPGTYSWIAPAGVISVCAVAIGGGGNFGGGGGGLGWRNNIAVIPGQSYTVVVGACAQGGTNTYYQVLGPFGPGGDSYFIDPTVVLGGGGGQGRGNEIPFGGTAVSGGTFVGQGGGNGGGVFETSTTWSGGGGGAGGYTGNGGTGGGATTRAGIAGSGGGGGGGGADVSNYGDYFVTGNGGGTGIYGIGNNGAAGTSGAAGGTEGGNGGNGSTNIGDGVAYGGGIGLFYNGARLEKPNGAVRIIWGPGRSFPNNAL